MLRVPLLISIPNIAQKFLFFRLIEWRLSNNIISNAVNVGTRVQNVHTFDFADRTSQITTALTFTTTVEYQLSTQPNYTREQQRQQQQYFVSCTRCGVLRTPMALLAVIAPSFTVYTFTYMHGKAAAHTHVHSTHRQLYVFVCGQEICSCTDKPNGFILFCVYL